MVANRKTRIELGLNNVAKAPGTLRCQGCQMQAPDARLNKTRQNICICIIL